MQDEDRFRLYFGPYKTPPVHIGDEIECALRGTVVVAGWTEALIPWPCCFTTRLSPIFCDGLLQALSQESNIAITHWWGFDKTTISRWRTALDIDRKTPGHLALCRAWIPETLSPEERAKGQALAKKPQNIEKMLTTRRQRVPRHVKPWTEEEEALLGTEIDRVIAERLNRSRSNVKLRRHQLGIAPFETRHQAYHQHNPDVVTLDIEQLKKRRLSLGLTQTQLAPLSGIHHVAYSQLETGLRCRVKKSTLEKLAGALRCRPEDLIA